MQNVAARFPWHELKADAAFDDEAARKLLLTFFEALGGENPLVSTYRRRMSSLLFV